MYIQLFKLCCFYSGVGKGTHLGSLSQASSSPISHYAMTADSFDSLGDMAYPLTHATNTQTASIPSSTSMYTYMYLSYTNTLKNSFKGNVHIYQRGGAGTF